MSRPTTSPRRHLPLRAVGLAALATLALALPGPGGLATAPAGATTTALHVQGSINHTLSGVYPGVGPARPFSSPAFADITGDNTPEIVVASLDGQVEAFRATDRARLWSTSLGHSAIQSSPTIADLGGDGKPDVVVGTMDGRVVWLDGPTGHVVRTFREGSPLHCPTSNPECRGHGFFASPAVADINGDHVQDIVAPSYDHTVYAWSRTGGLQWRTYLDDSLWSSPVIADIDRDHKPEIVLGGDISAGNRYGAPQGGMVWVLRSNGTTYPGYPRWSPGQTVWSSPAVADLNSDGYPDIIVGTGTNWAEPNGRKVDAFTAKTRANLPGWPVSVDSRVFASPAVGDIDSDGALEVTFAGVGGYVYAYEANGARKWRVCNALTSTSCGGSTSTFGGTVIADVDGDGIQEVVSTLDKDVRVYDGRNGTVEAQYRMAHPATYPGGGSTPAIAEVNGTATIVQSSVYRSNGHGGSIAAGDLTKVYVFDTGHGLCRADWPQFHRDARRSGLYRNEHEAWLPFDCPADFVRQQYGDFLGRQPDASGTSYWTSRLHNATSGSSVIRSFIASAEFGRVVSPVVRSYLAVHGTFPPTKQLVDDGVAAYRAGTSTAADLADTYAQDNDIVALTDEQFVTNTYQHVYKRGPSPTELADGEADLQGGVTRGTFASGLAESSVGQSRLAAEVTVAMTYLGMLGRAPDPGGWSYWVAKTRATSSDTLVTGFQRSNEYANRVT